jgi:hypothetical protein
VEPGAALQGTQRPPSSPGGGLGRPQSGRSPLRPRLPYGPPGSSRSVALCPPPTPQVPPSIAQAAQTTQMPYDGCPSPSGGKKCRRPVLHRAAASPDRTGRRATGNGPGQGRGTWSLPAMAIVYTTGSILPTQLPASVASCQRSFRVGAADPRPLQRTASWRTAAWRTAAWRPPKHTGSRARTCGTGAPRVGPTALALHCRIGPTTHNCYWENAERTPSARGRDERGGRPAVLPVSGQESGGGRSRLLPSNKAPASCRLSPM